MSVEFLVVGRLVGITWYASLAEPRRAILLLLLDAARADRSSCYGYPIETTLEIDRLAHQGILFLNHYSQETSTRASLPQILFSRYFIKALFPIIPNVPFPSQTTSSERWTRRACPFRGLWRGRASIRLPFPRTPG